MVLKNKSNSDKKIEKLYNKEKDRRMNQLKSLNIKDLDELSNHILMIKKYLNSYKSYIKNLNILEKNSYV